MAEPQVKAPLAKQRCSKVHDLSFRVDVWMAKTHGADDKNIDIRIDPGTDQAIPDRQAARLGVAESRAKRSTPGYTHARDADFKDGLWKAKADNPVGKGVAQLDPNSDQAIGSDRD